MGSLLVGVSFAKGFARALGIPMIDVNPQTGHVLAHFIKAEGEENVSRNFPLPLLVSGGNSQIILVKAYNDMEILGQTIDDAAGEAIDKCSKVMGLGLSWRTDYRTDLPARGNPKPLLSANRIFPDWITASWARLRFCIPLRDWIKMTRFHRTSQDRPGGIAGKLLLSIFWWISCVKRQTVQDKDVMAVAGGVSANNGLRNSFREHAEVWMEHFHSQVQLYNG